MVCFSKGTPKLISIFPLASLPTHIWGVGEASPLWPRTDFLHQPSDRGVLQAWYKSSALHPKREGHPPNQTEPNQSNKTKPKTSPFTSPSNQHTRTAIKASNINQIARINENNHTNQSNICKKYIIANIMELNRTRQTNWLATAYQPN